VHGGVRLFVRAVVKKADMGGQQQFTVMHEDGAFQAFSSSRTLPGQG
jgi:hypothetical protein